MRRMRSTTAGLVGATLLSLALGACGSGGGKGDGNGGGGDQQAGADPFGSYCTLVKQTQESGVPNPPSSLKKGDPAAIRTWVDKVLTPQIAKVDAIIAVAPDAVVADWRDLRKVEQGLAQGLNAFLEPASIAAWRRLPAGQRSTAFLRQALAPLADVDKEAPVRIAAEIAKDCKAG